LLIETAAVSLLVRVQHVETGKRLNPLGRFKLCSLHLRIFFANFNRWLEADAEPALAGSRC